MSAMQDMTKGGAAGHLLRYAVPLMLGNWFQLAYNAVDSIIAGRFIGKDALAAEGIAGPVMNLVILGITGVCLGAGVLMSEFFGAKDGESLRRELNANLNLDIRELRLLNVYDLFGFSEELLEKTRYSVFGEVVTDSVTDSCDLAGRKYIAVEYLPGQFDQRAASAVDCVRLIDPSAEVRIRSSKLLLFDGAVTDEEIARIKRYYIMSLIHI